jgi:hypothetical protein
MLETTFEEHALSAINTLTARSAENAKEEGCRKSTAWEWEAAV